MRSLDYQNVASAAPTAEPEKQNAESLLIIRWRDPEDGFAEAKRTKRPLLLDFTAEWCGWCKRLDADVLSKPEVSKYINLHYVPVRVMDRMNEDRRNPKIVSDLQAHFGVRGFPFLAVTSRDLKQYSVQSGYHGEIQTTLSFLSKFIEQNKP